MSGGPFGQALASIVPEGKRGALLVKVDATGATTAAVATRFGDTWRVGAEFRYDPKEKKPSGLRRCRGHLVRGHAMKDRMLQFFVYGHLPERLAAISKPFSELAEMMVDTLPSNPERTVALRKLLEAKDCAVRAELYLGDPPRDEPLVPPRRPDLLRR